MSTSDPHHPHLTSLQLTEHEHETFLIPIGKVTTHEVYHDMLKYETLSEIADKPNIPQSESIQARAGLAPFVKKIRKFSRYGHCLPMV